MGAASFFKEMVMYPFFVGRCLSSTIGKKGPAVGRARAGKTAEGFYKIFVILNIVV